ncbi:4-(cytidine 5'-diphospho)-2-C-methyl-D-erythritol kinase [Virgibacillus sp. MSP4-1]|uniref:4-(cytidine 5'-diphospho)-2-C-methyl-D-erythritol kinase n=1 Tax=Virgibacillus sp. MSP4-1 TaxID=2700081 RepID=UPI0003AACE8D|nr:4-(cytidine 5'-diphospho)-2-C-methyl-D-erythritol kinase [Virgibacillus sp. MSP4-1]QHS23882.1 4-(cytidine 5'-diphospho)-2-C-methyl-D-erythritol kinase [Virgibacillus sp. MSP4-1]
MIVEKAPAKINLTLDVLHKRDDGYHEVEMIMTTVDLYDQVQMMEIEADTIQVQSEKRFVPDDHRNLAYQAAEKIKQKFNITKGVNISIYKQIPVAAGLAGGSSDAAAVLRGLNQLWNLNLTQQELAEIGTEIGSDVAFCVYGGTALAKGRGEQIEPLPAPPKCWVILAKPAIGISTGTIYGNLTESHMNQVQTDSMIEAITEHNYQMVCQELANVLEIVTMEHYPEVRRMKYQMLKSGADNVLMSGSGPTIFGLTRKESRAERVYNSLRGFCEEVYIVRMLG